jgi:hypothetical protein
MNKLYIMDVMFSHTKSSSWYNQPTKFEWVRKYDEDHIILTDTSLHNVDYLKNKKKYAWILESPEITSDSYEFIKSNFYKFDKIFTFDSELLKIDNRFIFTPIGGCWIEEKDRIISKKNKKTSMIISEKKQTSGHVLRHNIYNTIDEIDYFGYMNPIVNKTEALKDYMFSIVVENSKKDYYFTEKIIDCFITGTIPIYYGCPSINNFFDINGIITFNNIEELKNILDNIDSNYYESKKEHIKNNYEESKKYLIAEDKIYEYITQFNY